jgi:hypothetical protein
MTREASQLYAPTTSMSPPIRSSSASPQANVVTEDLVVDKVRREPVEVADYRIKG